MSTTHTHSDEETAPPEPQLSQTPIVQAVTKEVDDDEPVQSSTFDGKGKPAFAGKS